jgi:hypothetical protein
MIFVHPCKAEVGSQVGRLSLEDPVGLSELCRSPAWVQLTGSCHEYS